MTLIFRILYLVYRVYSGVRHRAVRRFTRAGLAVVAGVVVAGAMGVDTDNNVDYQAFALLLALILVSFSFTFFFRGRFKLTRRLPRFGTAGCPLSYTLTVRNDTRRIQKGLWALENLLDPRPGFPEWFARQREEARHARSFRVSQHHRTHPFRVATWQEKPLPAVPPAQEVDVPLEITPLRRGVLRFKGLTLARPDPLGLCRALVRVDLPQTVLVLPRRYPLPPFALPGSMKYQQGGVALASNVGQSEEFVSLREYRHGDPVRHIHWRSWARAGKPVVKEFEDEFFVRHALILDTFASGISSEVFEEAVSVAASFACTLQTQESLLDLLFVGPESFCFTAGRGVAHADQMLEILAAVQVCHDQPFTSLEHLVLDHVSVVSGCVCVLIAWDNARRALVRKLQALGLPVLVLLVVAPGERPRLDFGDVQLEAGRLLVLESGQIERGLSGLR